MRHRQFVTFSYIPELRPELHDAIEDMPKGKRSELICNQLDPKMTEIEPDTRLDRVLELLEKMALQSDYVEQALIRLASGLAQGTPMQAIVEQVQGGDLPPDVLDNLAGLGG
jgi:hypothetical protein